MVVGLFTIPVLISVVPVSNPGSVVVTMTREAVAPEPREPMVHTGGVHVPVDGVALTTVSDEGIVSLTVIEFSVTEPELLTVIV